MKGTVDDHSCQTESCSYNLIPACALIGGSLKEISNQILEARIVPSRKAALEDGTKMWSVLCEQPEAALGAADISCENHCGLICPYFSVRTQRRYLVSPLFYNRANRIRCEPQPCIGDVSIILELP